MAMDAHLQSLNERHRSLEEQISSELKRPQKNESRLHELKRLKLRIKDQIAGLTKVAS